MNIRIIKNAEGMDGKSLIDNKALKVEKEPDEDSKFYTVKYFLYDLEKNDHIEIAPEIKKKHIVDVCDVQYMTSSVYFSDYDELDDKNIIINLYKYDVKDGKYGIIYSFKEDIENFDEYMRIKIFVLNDYYLVFQREFLRSNLAGNYEDYLDFEISMVSVKDQKEYRITDEKLVMNGISVFRSVSENMAVIKTGYSLLKDERYNFLEKDEASLECVSFLNIRQFISDVLLKQSNLAIDTIDQVYYTSTIPYLAIKNDYIIYSRVDTEGNHTEEVIFYNYKTKDSIMCINNNVYHYDELAKTCIINNRPFIMINTVKGVDLYDIAVNRADVTVDKSIDIKYVVDDYIVGERKIKKFFKEKNYVAVYKYPGMQELHREKGAFAGCASIKEDDIFIMLK